MSYETQLKNLLKLAVKEKASDVHFSVGHPPTFRIDRRLVGLEKFKALKKADLAGLSAALLSAEQEKALLTEKEIGFSYELEEGVRFRVNTFHQRGNISIAMRLIPVKVKTIDELNLPPILHEFTKAPQGFVLITGPSSHGKSTTLAALIDEINHQTPAHIITIEDPIEYFFKDDQSLVDQREVGSDTKSFAKALRSTFRQDPDVIMVGEMRDPETISTAITAAETGHLVLSTLHTNDSARAIHRMVDSFPSSQQEQIRAQLSASLLGVVSQRLLPRIRGGLIPACEIMISTPAVTNLIRENKIHELPMIIETSADMGMITLNKSLSNLVRAKEISLRTAIQFSLNPMELRRLVGGL